MDEVLKPESGHSGVADPARTVFCGVDPRSKHLRFLVTLHNIPSLSVCFSPQRGLDCLSVGGAEGAKGRPKQSNGHNFRWALCAIIASAICEFGDSKHGGGPQVFVKF